MSEKTRRLALVAHDHCKTDMIQWAEQNRDLLGSFDLVATGTTGSLLNERLDLDVECLLSGPLGGDLQVGALIAEQKVDALFFFWDPLTPQPHDPDVRALLRLAVMWNLPVACNRSTADLLLSSPFLKEDYQRRKPNFTRDIEAMREEISQVRNASGSF